MKRYYRVIYGIDDFVEVEDTGTIDENELDAKIKCQDCISERIGSDAVVEDLGTDEDAAFKQYEANLELDELKNAIKVLKRSPQLARLKAHMKRITGDASSKGWLDCIEFITNGGLLGLPKTHPMDRHNKLGKVKDLLVDDDLPECTICDDDHIPPKSEWKNITIGVGKHLEQSIINEMKKKK